MIRVAAVVGDRAGAFELGILSQTFGLDRSDDDLPRHHFAVCSPAGPSAPVPTTCGFTIAATHGLDHAATAADVVAIPAWPDLDDPLEPEVAGALRHAADRGAVMLSICTGAFALASAGLLDGRRATTHWQFADRFATRYPNVDLDRDVLYVDAGQTVTSAGAAAGLDACLHLLARLHGAKVANAFARRMVMPPHRDGGQAQFVEHPMPTRVGDTNIAALLDWVVEHLDQRHSVAGFADRAAMSPRTFARRFHDATGTTPGRWLTHARVQRAAELLETTNHTVDAIAHSVGFDSADTLRHHFRRQRDTTPSHHRATFAATLESPPSSPPL